MKEVARIEVSESQESPRREDEDVYIGSGHREV
jgi:hypothetical protein